MVSALLSTIVSIILYASIALLGYWENVLVASQLREFEDLGVCVQAVIFVLAASQAMVVEDDEVFLGFACEEVLQPIGHPGFSCILRKPDLVNRAVAELGEQVADHSAFEGMRILLLLSHNHLFRRIWVWSIHDANVYVVVSFWFIETSIARLRTWFGTWPAHCDWSM